MTFTKRKMHIAIALIVTMILVPTVALANADFTDVPTGAFYDQATSWAKLNNITTGSPAGSDTFRPLDTVTRGESVVFLKRYHDNVVQPSIDAINAVPDIRTTSSQRTWSGLKAAGKVFSVAASCPVGQTPISGGFQSYNVDVMYSYPTVGDATAPGDWVLGAQALVNGASAAVILTCAS